KCRIPPVASGQWWPPAPSMGRVAMTALRDARPSPHDARRQSAQDMAAAEIAAREVSDRAEGEAYVASVCFKHGPPRLLGVELEYTVHDAVDPGLPLSRTRLADALGPYAPRTLVPDSPEQPLPAGSTFTLEPGRSEERRVGKKRRSCWRPRPH